MMCTYLKTWFLFDTAMIALDVLTILALSSNLRVPEIVKPQLK